MGAFISLKCQEIPLQSKIEHAFKVEKSTNSQLSQGIQFDLLGFNDDLIETFEDGDSFKKIQPIYKILNIQSSCIPISKNNILSQKIYWTSINSNYLPKTNYLTLGVLKV